MSSKRWFKWAKLILPLWMIFGLPSMAFAGNALKLGQVVNGYSNCSWNANPSGSATLKVTLSFKDAPYRPGPPQNPMHSRAIVVYLYDGNGNVIPAKAAQVPTVKMNGANFRYTNILVGGAIMFFHDTVDKDWGRSDAYDADVEILVVREAVSDWPAVSILAVNRYAQDPEGEVTGGAYLSRDGSTDNCYIVDPEKPPPPPFIMSMNAPDWSLGELQAGSVEKTLSAASQQLCFSYSGADVIGKKIVIDASNVNGIASNRYRLKNVKDASQLVPYKVTLDSGTSTLSLPNSTGTALYLNGSGRTCFVPKFNLTVGENVAEGDYSDVLTFTVVTKS
ncbi:hypothetical protein [Burkholderia cenocepacia]|uniref:hypothetical protein n=1 Tax=Burkholderia cenocepacia TaxID=95486 RepID=UPI002AB6BC4D|nr:hypothetical protein [Burkholderia cenocepacia]